MRIRQRILTQNPCYTAKRKITVKGLMLHSVGCPQPSAKVFVESWNTPTKKVCVHAFIDGNTGDVYQTLPWNHRGWHCGGSANNTHIGVEMCEPPKGADRASARAMVQRTYDNAVSLFAHLCTVYGLDPMTDIISHREGAKRGVASNHADPEHLWSQLGMGYTMDTFRKAVKNALCGHFKVRVSTDRLNVRSGAGIEFAVTTAVKRGEVYTIVDTTTNGSTLWGKLKSGAGWISLKYTEKI